MKRSIITLLTDFGTRDAYVASMKGVILGINPYAALVDITHDVEARNVMEGAFLLGEAFSSFPKGTIHVAVVDPGVGGPRRPVLIVTAGYFFIGPDNGLFAFALRREKVRRIVLLDRAGFFRTPVSATFHGRDLFAPVAAHLSVAGRPGRFGRPVETVEPLCLPEPFEKGRRLTGQILHEDRFGNLLSNIGAERFARFTEGRPFVIRAKKRAIHSLSRTYGDVDRGSALALAGGSGLIELSVREGHAGKVLGLRRGDPVTIELSKA
jgi:S-adenosyl-L-methionine hydrolase (adenosine-forming)